MVAQLNSRLCPIGYDPDATPLDSLMMQRPSKIVKKGSLLSYVRDQKTKYRDSIILTRVGEFYETYGVDAIMLVEHCGLNPMGGKAKAGCPVRNVQATLDCLTEKGFRVEVYEETVDTDSSTGAGASAGAKSRLKTRMWAQTVSSATPTYMYNLQLENADVLGTAPAARPYMGVIATSAGYTVVEVSMEERTARVSERLTAEAVACRLSASPAADPLIYVPLQSERDAVQLPFLPSRTDASREGPGCRLRTRILSPSTIESPRAGVSDVERARNIIVGCLMQGIEHPDGNDSRLSVKDFMVVSSTSEGGLNPLYAETATQLGLMDDKTIPDLISYLLLPSAPAATRRFLRQWLLIPPPPPVADAMSSLVSILKNDGSPLPVMAVPPVGKINSLLLAGQASAQVYGTLLAAIASTVFVLDEYSGGTNERSKLIPSLMTVLQHQSGIAAAPESLRARCLEAANVIEAIVSPLHHAGTDIAFADDQISDYGDLIPLAFFERNELHWRGRVRSSAAPDTYEAVRTCSERLVTAIAEDFWGLEACKDLDECMAAVAGTRTPIMQDIFNNIIAIKDKPSWADDKEKRFFHPRDRNGKTIHNRYTTENVQSALSDYVSACDQACTDVTNALSELGKRLCDEGHLPAIVQAAHSNLILSTAFHHAANSNQLGWNTVQVQEDMPIAGRFKAVWPYWMKRSAAVANTFNMDGMFLLTAPNMSGKSTLMRSTAAAALLVNCGLCAPLGPNSMIRRFDNIFVRGASADVPTEEKSAFGAEMGDIASLLRSCGPESLVFVDELGRGTSPKDGTCLAGALLEAMSTAGMSGIFATHLHGVFDLPLQGQDRIKKKRMVTEQGFHWTYRMEDGICRDSLALVTAARFGLPENIIRRAAAFSESFSDEKPLPANNSEENPALTTPVYLRNGHQSTALVHEITLERAVTIAQEVTGSDTSSVHQIPPIFHSPPSLEGRSCIYILQIDSTTSAPQYYVGETDSLERRIREHRSKGGPWSHLHAVAIPIAGGKTNAREAESLVIEKLSKAGFSLVNRSTN
jgi:hypothetical protein